MRPQGNLCWKIGKITSLIFLIMILVTAPGRPANLALAQSDASLLFIENTGQFDEGTHFLVRMGETTLQLSDDALWLTILKYPALQPEARQPELDPRQLISSQSADDKPAQAVTLKLSFAGANPRPRLEPFNRLDTQVAYFTGDPTQWRTNVPVWGGVRYKEIYPGLDWELTGENGQLVQRLVVRDEDVALAASGESVSNSGTLDRLEQVQMQVEGADSLRLEDENRLHLTTAAGELTLPLLQPVTTGGTALDLPSVEASLDDQKITAPFATSTVETTGIQSTMTAQATASKIPELLYSTFLGGAESEQGQAIAIDEAGNAYITGHTVSPDFPTTPGAFSPTNNNRDVFVAKLNSDGSDLIFATFLGGSEQNDLAHALAVDEAHNVYIGGVTDSPDFPTTPAAFDTQFDGLFDLFAVKLNPTGTELIYSTFIGGSDNETGDGLAIDQAGNAYISGDTYSDDFPATPGAFDTQLDGDSDAFVAKLNPDGSALIYASLVGGSYFDFATDIAVDESGSAYLMGYTWSDDFPATPGASDTVLNGRSDTFVAKFNVDGSGLDYASFLGGDDCEVSRAIAIDGAGNAFLAGDTWSANFSTTAGAYDTTFDGNSEIYVVKLNGDGSGLVYATFLGSSDVDFSYDMTVDEAGNAYVTGNTVSGDFPITNGTIYSETCSDCGSHPVNTEGFAAKLNPSGSELLYSTFIGGGLFDYGYAIAVDSQQNAFITGFTGSRDFPISDTAYDTNLDDGDVYVMKLATGDEGSQPPPSIPAHTCAPTPLGQITVGHTPRGLAVDPARQRLYVANFGSNSVSVVDTNTNTILQTITGLTTANGLAYDSTHNLIWVTNYDLDQLTPIQANDQATGFTLLSPISMGEGPWGVAFDPINNLVYVANSLDNSVSVVDAASRSLVATLTGSFDEPFHLAAHTLNGKVYVANTGNNTVTVLQNGSIVKMTPLWDSGAPYGIAVDETRDLIYVATVQTNRIVAIGPLNGQSDQFLGWAAFQRGYNRHRPVPLRAIAVNPEIGPAFDGGHLWATTATGDGSEADQALLIPKGWSSYFHVPFTQDVGANPTEGIAIDRLTQRVYVSSGTTPGQITVTGDHANICSGIAPAAVSEDSNQINLDIFSLASAARSDINGDGQVNIADLAYVAGQFGSGDPQADINGDGSVDIADLAIVANHFGRHLPEFE